MYWMLLISYELFDITVKVTEFKRLILLKMFNCNFTHNVEV